MTKEESMQAALSAVQSHPAWSAVGDPDRDQRLAVACEVYAHEFGVEYAALRDAVASLPPPAPVKEGEE